MALISQNQQITELIERTDFLFDSGIDSTTPSDGATLLDQWLTALQENGNDVTDAIADTLEQLKTTLADTADAGQIGELLQQLIHQTRMVMEMPEASAQQIELERLLATLDSLNRQMTTKSEE
jgi:ABC-type transporter Mla subunit MlaD